MNNTITYATAKPTNTGSSALITRALLTIKSHNLSVNLLIVL